MTYAIIKGGDMTVLPGVLALIDQRLMASGNYIPHNMIQDVYVGRDNPDLHEVLRIRIAQAIRIELPHWEDPRG